MESEIITNILKALLDNINQKRNNSIGVEHTTSEHQSENPKFDTTEVGDDDKIINFISDNIKIERKEKAHCDILVTPKEQNKENCILWIKLLIEKNGNIKQIIEKEQLNKNLKRVLYENYVDLRLVDQLLHWFKPQDDGSVHKLIIIAEQMDKIFYKLIYHTCIRIILTTEDIFESGACKIIMASSKSNELHFKRICMYNLNILFLDKKLHSSKKQRRRRSVEFYTRMLYNQLFLINLSLESNFGRNAIKFFRKFYMTKYKYPFSIHIN
ncbi:hypothetical protein BpHYR1_026692 [Brachionus plicatilis]|uniref:Uncharacterized protein n=1 Tax=Brachionus plicatilis TaxID=10195 RepID=A0A3M7R4N6_BRAPC|nr:hypothetical protein BpHYR1_026692 [Brachionus plicatilis]